GEHPGHLTSAPEQARHRLAVPGLRVWPPAASTSGWPTSSGRALVRTAAGSESAARARRRRGLSAGHSTGPQLVQVGEVDARQRIEKVGLGGADAVRGSLGAGTKSSADGHAGHRTDGRVARNGCGAWPSSAAALVGSGQSFCKNSLSLAPSKVATAI